jgi:hypothetical protein
LPVKSERCGPEQPSGAALPPDAIGAFDAPHPKRRGAFASGLILPPSLRFFEPTL